MEAMKIRNDGIADRPIAPRGALPPDALPTGADGSPAAAVTAAPPHPQPQPQPQPKPHPPPSRPRYMLSRTGRSCALMCDRTPDNARQEMLHARPRRDSLQVRPRRLRLQLCSGRGEGRRLNGGCCMMLLPAQPAPDIRAVKRSPRSTRACDPRAPPRWHGCLQVSACTYTKKRKYSTVHELLRRGALAHARARDLLVCVWRGATRVASDA